MLAAVLGVRPSMGSPAASRSSMSTANLAYRHGSSILRCSTCTYDPRAGCGLDTARQSRLFRHCSVDSGLRVAASPERALVLRSRASRRHHVPQSRLCRGVERERFADDPWQEMAVGSRHCPRIGRGVVTPSGMPIILGNRQEERIPKANAMLSVFNAKCRLKLFELGTFNSGF